MQLCPSGLSSKLDQLLLGLQNKDALIVGDLSAHQEAWFTRTTSLAEARRRDEINESVDASSFVILNRDKPTRLPARGPPSSPDVAIITAHLSLGTMWSVFFQYWTPITFQSLFRSRAISHPNQLSLTNFRKDDWKGYREESEQAFLMLPSPLTCAVGAGLLWRVLLTAAKHNIPSGRLSSFS